MRLPSFSDLQEEVEQLAVYLQPTHESILVVGPPGSGKTSLAIWRARVIAQEGQNVTIITRSRMLVGLAGQLAIEDGGTAIQASTMHTFFWHAYKNRFGVNPPTTVYDSYVFEWTAILEQYQKEEVIPTIHHLIIDEGQNLPWQFIYWAKNFGAKVVSIFADEHQTTLDSGTTMTNLLSMNFLHCLLLKENHRNTWEIAALASQFHVERKLPEAVRRREPGAQRPQLLQIRNWQELAQVIQVRLTNSGESIGVITYRQQDISQIFNLLKSTLHGERVDSYDSKMDDGAELIRMRDRGVTVISGESAIGLEFEAVYLHDLDRSLPPKVAADVRRLYMLIARARDFLFLVNGPVPLSATQLGHLPLPPLLER